MLKLIFAGLIFTLAILPLFHAFLNVYRPRLPVRSTPQEDGLKFDTITFATSDGQTLRGWFLYGPARAPLVVVCHGVGTNREDLRAVSRFLCRSGFNVLAFDFRAHGESSGYRTTFGFREALDVEAAVRFAEERYAGKFKGIGLYAISMGSAAAMLASQHLSEVKAFVFDSPFARLVDLVDLQFSYLPKPLRSVAAGLTCFFGSLLAGVPVAAISPEDSVTHLGSRPVLLFHGDEDALIPVSQGRRLFQKISGPKEFVETRGAGHVQSYFVMGKDYEDRVVRFFKRHLTNEGS